MIFSIYNDKKINNNHEIIDLVEESQMPSLISAYLSSEYEREKLSLSILKTQTDVLLTDKKISQLVASFNCKTKSNECFTSIQDKNHHVNLCFNFDDIIETNNI